MLPLNIQDERIHTMVQNAQKLRRLASRESGLTRYTIRNVLKKKLNFRPWKQYYCNYLSPKDCDHLFETGEMMFAWYEDWSDIVDNILWSVNLVLC